MTHKFSRRWCLITRTVNTFAHTATTLVVFSLVAPNLVPLGLVLFSIDAKLSADEKSTERVRWTTSRILGSPDPPTPYRTAVAFPNLKFDEPVDATFVPGCDRMVVVERFGKIYTFENTPDASQKELLLDLQKALNVDRCESFGIAFHPQFTDNGRFFVHHHSPKEKEPTRVSEFVAKANDNGQRLHADHDSERTIIRWPAGHNGGCVKFGQDGYLYISNGDQGGLHDPYEVGQGINDLQASILRIDVDATTGDLPYRIPPDNPFVEIQEARHEVWAYGLRNPWKFSFDRETGEMWTADVGEDLWESIHKVKSGGNYGWSIEEGGHPFRPTRKRGPTPIEKPIVAHAHIEARSISGGFVYRGSELQNLVGRYIYGDYDTGKIWSILHDGKQLVAHDEICDSSMRLVGFGEDHAGELVLVDHIGGYLHKLLVNDRPDTSGEFPRKLSDTGLFESTANLTPAPGLIAYDVAAPQWCDGATKQRYMAIPGNGQIEFEAVRFPFRGGRDGWKFPDGTVLVETHFMEMETGNPASQQRIETRILHHERILGPEEVGDQIWRGYTYVWNDDQSDAELLENPNGLDRKLTIRDPNAPGGQRQQTWHFPARTECTVCHNMAAKYVLGCQTLQLNHDVVMEDAGIREDVGIGGKNASAPTANQLDYFKGLNLFTEGDKVVADELPKLADYHDEAATLNDRARAYLHANCSHCHRNGGGGNADFFALASMEFDQLRMLGAKANHGQFQIQRSAIVKPGRPLESLVYYRMSCLGGGRMPRLGSSVVDAQGLNLIHDWIMELAPADPNDEPSTQETSPVDGLSEQLQILVDEGSTVAERTTSINRLLATTSGALRLARAAQNDELNASVRKAAVTAAVQGAPHIRNLFERFLPEELRTKRLGRSVVPATILALDGDVEQGRALFEHASGVQCRDCHRIKSQGKAVGPDLDEIGKKYDRSQILTSILEPSRNIDAKYMQYQCVTNDGRIHTGLVVEKTAEHVVIRDAKSDLHTIAADQIDELSPLTVSMMPELLVQDLTAQQLADLVAFLDSLE